MGKHLKLKVSGDLAKASPILATIFPGVANLENADVVDVAIPLVEADAIEAVEKFTGNTISAVLEVDVVDVPDAEAPVA